MTTVTYRAGTMAADGRMIRGYSITDENASKVSRRTSDGALVGCSGGAAFASAFQDWFHKGGEGQWPTADKEAGDRAIVVYIGGLVEMFDFSGRYSHRPEYVAMGSGIEFAMGAMAHGATAAEAVAAAHKHDPQTGPNVFEIRHVVY